jgi:hypothetical protein
MKQSSFFSRRLLIFLGLAALVLAIGYKLAKPPGRSSAASDSTALPGGEQTPESATAVKPAEDSELRELSPEQVSKAAQLPAIIQATNRSVHSAGPTPVRIDPTPYSRQLMGSLTNIDFSKGPITPEQAEQWKQGLQALTGQGAAAVPAIREFLELNHDLNFTAISGGELLAQTSLRTALINALQQIGGPEATAQLVQTLQTTTVPSEIALIAQNLEQLAPGQYRQEALNAASEVLAMASKGQLPGWDVGALFKMFQNYGDSASASALEQFQSQWKYYAAMSLAGLPAGQGVPGLIHQAQDPSASHDFAFQMLAQVAAQSPEASAALLEQARLNHIPDNAWRKIAAGLAGEQYLVGTPPPDIPLSGLKQFHIEAGNQNFYSLPVTASAQAGQGIALIDQLLGLTSNPAAISALQSARASLSGPSPK